jgi:UDP-N-acetylmuramyl pentapeptide phosphotransferase/UDP-N-acetylglucosamine-1-phosphate transferase
VIKVSVLMAAVCVACAAAAPQLLGLCVVAGAAAGLLVPDLRERMMLGDAGANPLGATLGLAAVLVFAPMTRNWLLAALVVLNLASERVSFSRVIDRVAPLRLLDQLGRQPSGR